MCIERTFECHLTYPDVICETLYQGSLHKRSYNGMYFLFYLIKNMIYHNYGKSSHITY